MHWVSLCTPIQWVWNFIHKKTTTKSRKMLYISAYFLCMCNEMKNRKSPHFFLLPIEIQLFFIHSYMYFGKCFCFPDQLPLKYSTFFLFETGAVFVGSFGISMFVNNFRRLEIDLCRALMTHMARAGCIIWLHFCNHTHTLSENSCDRYFDLRRKFNQFTDV